MEESYDLDIREQPYLSLRRTGKITVIGVRYRLFRSMVTIAVVSVAVAFLMNILSESVIKKAIALRTQHRLAEMRQATHWSARLTISETPEQAIRNLAGSWEEDAAYVEAQRLAGFTEEEALSLKKSAERAARYMNFFTDLDYGRQRALVKHATGAEIFNRLQAPEHFEQFQASLATMKSVRFPTSMDEFQRFLQGWPQLSKQIEGLLTAKRGAIRKVSEWLEGRPVRGAMVEADGRFGDAIRQAGFALSEDAAAVIAGQARRGLEADALAESVNNADVRRSVAGYLDILPSEVDIRVLWDLLRSREHAEWYAGKLREFGLPAAEIAGDRMVAIAHMKSEEKALQVAGELAEDIGSGFMGLGERMSWLVVASMMVCIVGITNAMLMSVTERFREIATLKCLGALDSFIMLMFVLEACFLGLVGGLAGVVLGVLLGLGRMLLMYGAILVMPIPTNELARGMGLALVVGVILAAVASVYPSFKAAKLAPMEAMRIE